MLKKIDPRNLVCHCTKGTSDKVYIASIRDNPDMTFTVVGKWGRNGKLNLMQMEQCRVDNWYSAAREQQSLFNSKLAKGYININDSQYKGNLTYSTPCIKNNLEESLGFSITLSTDNYSKDQSKRKTVQPINIIKDNEDTRGRKFDLE